MGGDKTPDLTDLAEIVTHLVEREISHRLGVSTRNETVIEVERKVALMLCERTGVVAVVTGVPPPDMGVLEE